VKTLPQDMMSFSFSKSNVSVILRDHFLEYSSLKIIRGDKNHLTAPFHLPSSITILSLTQNSISSVSGFALGSLKFLQDISLADNCIERLENGDFLHIPSLRRLDLGNQKTLPLRLGSGSIANLPMLSELRLSGNAMTKESVEQLENIGTNSSSLWDSPFLASPSTSCV
jgi:Leucine-rich repeat (LRR) protein